MPPQIGESRSRSTPIFCPQASIRETLEKMLTCTPYPVKKINLIRLVIAGNNEETIKIREDREYD